MMPKNVAGSKRAKADRMLDNAMVVIALVPAPNGGEIRIDNRAGLDDEDIAIAMREAADQLEGKHDRAKGMW